MSTRIYIPGSSAAPAISPTPSASWTDPTTYLSRVIGRTTKTDTTQVIVTVTGTATNPDFFATRQVIVGPLAAQTFSGTFKGQMRGDESSASLNARHAIVIRIMKPDATERAVLRSIVNGAEFTGIGTLTNAQFASGVDLNLTNGDSVAGDYLLIELGIRDSSTISATARQAFSDLIANSDLPEDTTDTGAKSPWIEFTHNIVFATAGMLPRHNGLGGLGGIP